MISFPNLCAAFLIGAFLLSPARAQECKEMRIGQTSDIRSSSFKLYTINEKDRIVETGETIERAKAPLPFVLEDCGDPKYLIWRRSGTIVLVEKSVVKKFCLEVAEARNQGGSPGSGVTEDCK